MGYLRNCHANYPGRVTRFPTLRSLWRDGKAGGGAPEAAEIFELMEAHIVPAGQAVVRKVVSTVAREGVYALADANRRRRDPHDRQ